MWPRERRSNIADESAQPLPARLWNAVAANVSRDEIPVKIRVATFNVLSEAYQTGRAGHWERWENRGERLLHEILSIDADVVCLQEVDHYAFFQKRLEPSGYQGVWLPKTKKPQERRIDPEDGAILNFEELLLKYQGVYGHAEIRHYWVSEMTVCKELPTEGQAIFVKCSRWIVQAKCGWTCFNVRRSSGLRRTWMQWIDSKDLQVFDEGAAASLAPSLFTRHGVCPLPQVSLGVVVSLIGGGPCIGILNLHIKSNPRELSKLGLEPEVVKFEQLQYFINRAQCDLVEPSRALGLVVCGDLNQTLSQEQLQVLSLSDTHFGVEGCNPAYRSRIDYILLRQPCILQVHETLSVPNAHELGIDSLDKANIILPNEVYPSDHIALAASIAIDSGA